MGLQSANIFYDWNIQPERGKPDSSGLIITDNTLRDGLQSPSAIDPSIEEKLRILHLLDRLGVKRVDLGFPASSPRNYQHVLRMAQEIERENLMIRPGCTARTKIDDIRPILEIANQVGISIEIFMFIGSSRIRALVENWDRELLIARTEKAIGFAIDSGYPVTYITEDTTRSHPDVLKNLFKAALETGAGSLCLCDTVGYSTPRGVHRLIEFTRDLIAQQGVEAKIEWHGHNDRGLALANAIAAIDAGADCIHGTVLGIGERTGNTPLDQLLIHLNLQGLWSKDLTYLKDLCETVSSALQIPIPCNYPGFGQDAFRTATGVHAAALLKVLSHPDSQNLADSIYSSVPASMLGKEQEVYINHMSGKANVQYWFQRRGILPKPETVEAILRLAKSRNDLLQPGEIDEIAVQHGDLIPALEK